MKVMLINTLYTPYIYGGAEISVQTLAENLVSLEVEVAVITLGDSASFFNLNGVKIWRIKIKNKYWPFSDSKKTKIDKLLWHFKDISNKNYNDDLINIIERFKPDVIHTNNLSGFSTYIWTVAKKLNIKIIHTLRDYYLQCPGSTKFKNNKICVKRCVDCYCLSVVKKKVSQKVDCVVGISDFILKDHVKEGYFLNSHKEVIYNGFEMEFTENKKNEIIQNKKINFGFIGQINASKGIEILLESFNNLLEFENWSLVIAGRIDGEYKKKLLGICSSNRIKFLGFTDSDEFYKSIDVVIVPSIWNEPFGRVVMEGIIKGKVVLGSETGGIPELLKNNKDFMFKPNSKGLTITLKNLLNNPKKLNNFKIEPSFLSNFHIRKTVFSYRNLYVSIKEGSL